MPRETLLGIFVDVMNLTLCRYLYHSHIPIEITEPYGEK